METPKTHNYAPCNGYTLNGMIPNKKNIHMTFRYTGSHVNSLARSPVPVRCLDGLSDMTFKKEATIDIRVHSFHIFPLPDARG
jgi:hypothetical protein